MALLVHVGLVRCYLVTVAGANHLVGLMKNLVVTDPWPGLMTSGPDRSVEVHTAARFGAAGCRRHGRYGVHTSSFQLLAQDFNLGCYGHEVLLPRMGGPHISYSPKMFE